jgi:hypothetical protein
MNNLDKTNKLTSVILLACIIIISCTYLIYLIISCIYKLISIDKELFRSSNSSNDKRNKMIKIYKNDDIPDPDENPEYNINDPDSTVSIDPDNKEYDNYENDNYDQYIKFGL